MVCEGECLFCSRFVKKHRRPWLKLQYLHRSAHGLIHLLHSHSPSQLWKHHTCFSISPTFACRISGIFSLNPSRLHFDICNSNIGPVHIKTSTLPVSVHTEMSLTHWASAHLTVRRTLHVAWRGAEPACVTCMITEPLHPPRT